MTIYKDLVKRLRAYNGWALNETLDAAADAIEYLVRLRNAAEENRLHWRRMAVEFEIAMHTAEEKLPKWIPVNERLPEFDQVVLVSDGHDVDTGWAVQFTERDGEKKVIWASPFADFDDVDSITHWMPLPEPPKEKPDEL